jgi:hypothetical protein
MRNGLAVQNDSKLRTKVGKAGMKVFSRKDDAL